MPVEAIRHWSDPRRAVLDRSEAKAGEALEHAAHQQARQVELGGKLFGAKCAGCHGDSGQGTSNAPRVVGLSEGALPLDPPPSAKYRKEQFKTVADVAGFVVKAMPPKAPGSLSEEEYFSILAFDLKANGIDLGDKKLDAVMVKEYREQFELAEGAQSHGWFCSLDRRGINDLIRKLRRARDQAFGRDE